jgi:hypothetical protein
MIRSIPDWKGCMSRLNISAIENEIVCAMNPGNNVSVFLLNNTVISCGLRINNKDRICRTYTLLFVIKLNIYIDLEIYRNFMTYIYIWDDDMRI